MNQPSIVSVLFACLLVSAAAMLCGCPEQARVDDTGLSAPSVDLASFPRPDDSEFIREVYESELPVLVDFGAEWCGPCKMLEPILHRWESDYADRLKIVTIDVDEEPDLASHYEVDGIPALLLFDQGVLLAVETGAPSEPQLRQWVASHVDLTAPVEANVPAENGATQDDGSTGTAEPMETTPSADAVEVDEPVVDESSQS